MKKQPGMRLPLARRFTLIFGVLVLLLFSAGGLVVQKHLARHHLSGMRVRSASLARNLSAICQPYLMNYDYVRLQQIADDALNEQALLRVVIADQDGMIAGYSGSRHLVGQRTNDPMILRSLEQSAPVEVERDDEGGTPVLERVAPILGEDEETRWGTICLTLSLQAVQDDARATGLLVLQFAIGGFLLTMLVSNWLARRVTRSLALLVDRASALEQGKWDPDFEIRTGDEIEILGEKFRDAADGLERQRRQLIEAHDELAALNATLEEKVRERTRELMESREKYKLLVESSPDPLCLIQNGHFLFVNRAFLEVFGYQERDLLSPDFLIEKVVHQDFSAVVADTLRQAEESGERIDADWVGVDRGGRTLDFSVRGRQITFHGAPAVELLWIDLTDKKKLLRQVVQGERLRAIGEMTAMVAHNFNNLLAVILGRAQLLHARAHDNGMRRGLEIIRASAVKGGKIISRLQDYSVETTGLRFQEIQIGSVLRDIAGKLERQWTTNPPRGKPVSIDVSVEPALPVLGSDALLGEVLGHILRNASESMPDGGTIQASVKVEKEMVQILIEDTGIGLDSDVRRRAFDPFFTTKGAGNRGLGLSATYGIIQRHRGRIELRDREGGGTVVEILLPMHRAPSVSDQASGPRVFVVSEEQETALRLRTTIDTAERDSSDTEPTGGAATSGRAA